MLVSGRVFRHDPGIHDLGVGPFDAKMQRCIYIYKMDTANSSTFKKFLKVFKIPTTEAKNDDILNSSVEY